MTHRRRRGARFGTAAAVVLLLGTAACGRPAPPPGEPTPIPTSDWTGGYAMAALLEGQLSRDPGGCLVVGDVVVLWPKGFTAVESGTGEVSVLDAAGVVVARTGSGLKVGGGERPAGGAGPCLEGREVFEVNDSPPAL